MNLNRCLILSLLTGGAMSLAAASHAALIVHEGFAEASNNQSINGYDGTASSTGLTGTWAWTNDTESEQRLKSSNAVWEGISNGFAPDGVAPDTGTRTFWEKNNNWGNSIAEADLASTIDLTADGEFYMSFFTKSKHNNAVMQIGLHDGTNELMWGNGFASSGPDDDPKGATAYYGAIDTDPITNGADFYIPLDDASATDAETHFYVAKIAKSDSGNSDTVTVSIYGYNLTTSNYVNVDPPAPLRTVTLTGVSTAFDHLQMKVNGGNDGSGNNWPAMDEVRIGDTWADVTGVLVPEPTGLTLVALSSLALFLRRK